ncbi:MAG: ribonuclease H [Dehalococcoidia bacterium]|nr:ribonuclease H [Dehalococcoidia bacterium]
MGNPGPGGYGVVVLSTSNPIELSGGFRRTTNNRMEIIAAIKALEALQERCNVKLVSDSEYLVNAISLGWAKKWQAKGWMRNKTERALNPDLWEILLRLCEYHQVEFVWIRGHSGNTLNQQCDRMAVEAAKQRNLPVDEGYDKKIFINPGKAGLW